MSRSCDTEIINMNWFENLLKKTVGTSASSASRHEIPEGVWTKCTSCEQVLYRAELERNLNVCPKCGHHMRISARTRLDSFLDKDGREELSASMEPKDILKFKDLKKYRDRLSQAQKSSGEKDALVTIKGTLKGWLVPLSLTSWPVPWALLSELNSVQPVNVQLKSAVH